jgi:hypothetical protein
MQNAAFRMKFLMRTQRREVVGTDLRGVAILAGGVRHG